MTKKTKHEKDVELAKAAAPRYGIYIEGGAAEDLFKAFESMASSVIDILNSNAEESTKRMALQLIEGSTHTIKNMNVSNVNIDFD